MEIYYAETPVGNVRITCNEDAVTQLEFIKNNFSGIPITIPKTLRCTFKENQLGKGSPLLPRGTEFQRMVWDALLNVPFGQTISYGEIAVLLGGKEKARAVGAAVGANPVAILIPCHRALPANGKTGKYRWGVGRKKSLLDWETANNEESQFFSAFFRP